MAKQRDLATRDAEIGVKPRIAAAIHDPAIADEDIESARDIGRVYGLGLTERKNAGGKESCKNKLSHVLETVPQAVSTRKAAFDTQQRQLRRRIPC